MELQRKITEYVKRALGLKHLQLWEGTPMVAEILDIEKAIERMVYFYTNPARANLVENISDYPGLCSWNSVDVGTKSTEIPWIRYSAVKTIPARQLTERQDSFITNKLCNSARAKHSLTYHFNAWMKCFGVTDTKEILSIRQRIRRRVGEIEKELCLKRALEKRRVLGVRSLKSAPIAQVHTPKKKQKKIFVLSSDPERRKAYIQFMRTLCQKCAELYQMARSGYQALDWPPGVFRPPLPPLASALAS